jgi:hypothetical protein
MRERLDSFARRVKKMSTTQVVILALTISVFSFVGWLGLCLVVWGLLRAIGIRFDFWPMLEAVSTAAAVAQFLGGGVVALVQLTESADGRNLGIYNDVFATMMSDENIEARRWIYLHLPHNPEEGISSLDPVGQAHVKRVLNSFDHLGFLLQQNWVTGDPVIHWVSPMVVKVWQKLGPYVAYEIKRRKEPDYYESAQLLAKRCQEWRATQMLDADIVWLNDAL